MASIDIECVARAFKDNISSSLAVTSNLTHDAITPADYLINRMNGVLRAVVESNFDRASLAAVGTLYAAIGQVQPQMMYNTHDLALINLSRSFAVVTEEAIRHLGALNTRLASGPANNNNKPASGAIVNNNNKPASGVIVNNNNKPASGAIVNNNNKPASGAIVNNNNNKPASGPANNNNSLAKGNSSAPVAASSVARPPVPAPRPSLAANAAKKTVTRYNKATDLGFASMPADAESKTLPIKTDNLLCFSGLSSVLATRHEFPISIDGYVYASVDHYYQIEKCKQLVPSKACPALKATLKKEDEQSKKLAKDLEALQAMKEDDKTKKPDTGTVEDKKKEEEAKKEKIVWEPLNYGRDARKFLLENRISPKTIESWRRTGGVAAVYKAMSAKVQQCSELRKYLHAAVNKIILHSYAGDAIFACGADAAAVRAWAAEMAKKGAKLQIPLAPLVNSQAVTMAPQIAEGRNLLGLIHMQLAEQIALSLGGCSNFLALPGGFTKEAEKEKKKEEEEEKKEKEDQAES